MTARRMAPILAVALLVRVVPVLLSARVTVDVLRYHKIAEHVLDVSWNPYEAPRLYPYPPLWIWFEAGALWLERHGASFPVVVKVPVVAADVGITALLAGVSPAAAWIYALHPVSVLVTGFHGQFDALMLLFLLLSLRAHEAGHQDRSAFALAAAIGTKSFPILLLPFFWLALPHLRARVRFVTLAVLPVALSLLPYVVHDLAAVRRELLAYSGIADFGWIGVVRGWGYVLTGHLSKSRPQDWGAFIPTAKAAFLAVYALLLGIQAWARRRLSPWDASLVVFLAFLVFYGSVSAQYLLWPIPFGARHPRRAFVLYSMAATAALVGFYAFLAPGVFFADETARPLGTLWVLGATAVLFASAWWLLMALTFSKRVTLSHGVGEG
jgi:hypothetical protein